MDDRLPLSAMLRRLPDVQLRWVILLLLFASTFLNYLDRSILGLVKSELKVEFGMGDLEYSRLVNAFMAPYIVMYVIGGRLVDFIGSRISMCLFIVVWSLATMSCGLVNGLVQLGICRALLGMAEPGNYPAGVRALASWFPANLRGLAMSLFSAGNALGLVFAAPVIAWLVMKYHWRVAFLVPGALGLVWAVVWWFAYRPPAGAVGPAVEPVHRTPWLHLLKQRNLWGIVLARLASDPVWYFYLFWLPGYFREKMGLTLEQVGWVGWIPFLVADVGGIGAGAFSDWLVRRGWAPVNARKAVLCGAALLGPVGVFTTHAPDLATTLVIFSIVALVCQTWLFNITSLLADVFPKESVGSVQGIAGAFGAVGGLIFNTYIGRIADTFGFAHVFMVAGGMHLVAAVILGAIVRTPAK